MTTATDCTRRPFAMDEAIAVLYARRPRLTRCCAACRMDYQTKAARPGAPFDLIGHLIHGEHHWCRARENDPQIPASRGRSTSSRSRSSRNPRAARWRACWTTLRRCDRRICANCRRWASPTPTSIAAAAIRSSASSPCVSCWRPGVEHLDPVSRPRACSPGSIRMEKSTVARFSSNYQRGTGLERAHVVKVVVCLVAVLAAERVAITDDEPPRSAGDTPARAD